jgi:cell wall-associated NlpC family hydrolase
MLLVGIVVGATTPATAQSAEIDAKQAEAANLEAEIAANGQKIARLDELAHQAELSIAQATAASAETQSRIDEASAHAQTLRELVVGRAVAGYVRGSAPAPVQQIDASSVADFQSQSMYTSIATRHDQSLIAEYKKAKEALAEQKRVFDEQQAAAAAQRDALEQNRAAVAAANAQQDQLLSQVNGDIATLVQQDQEAKATAAAAASAERLAQVTSAAANSPNSNATADTGASSSRNRENTTSAPPASSGAAAAVAYAYSQLGKPYCFGGVGPGCYDCSGLTMMSWAQAGVFMPHGSIAQGDIFPRVADSAMQPGDLIIEYSDHSHVSIYVGDGMMITAPHTGDVVKLVPVFAPGWGFQYAVRPR